MASGILAILDDVAMLLDDAAAVSKLATKKTIGILGDDLAVNAEKAAGFSASRELPVLWAIAKGAFLNKLIILPVAFLLSAFAPWLVKYILFLGALYLAFEGAEKIYEYFFHRNEKAKPAAETEPDPAKLLEIEDKKIKSAIFTDFILSIEIIVIALSALADQNLTNQIIGVSFVALLATVGVYGIVGLLVRMDDTGFYFINKGGSFFTTLGNGLVKGLPLVIKGLTIIGTLAMLLVAGGIFHHNIEAIHHYVEHHNIPGLLADFIIGLIVGAIVLPIEKLVHKLFFSHKKSEQTKEHG